MPINYPHIRSLAAAAAHDAVGFAARALARAGATFASAFAALATRFPSVQTRSLSRIMDQAIASINAALRIGAAGPGETVPVSQYGVNPAAPTQYEYRIHVTFRLSTSGQANREKSIDTVVRSSTPLDQETILLRGELLAENVIDTISRATTSTTTATVTSSHILTATVRGSI